MQQEALNERVANRNKQLQEFFTKNDLKVRLIGDDHNPAVILDEKLALSCHVTGYDLVFTSRPFSDHHIKTYRLTDDIYYNPTEIRQIIDMCEHRNVFKIKMAGTPLYLTGYNYIEPDELFFKYPVFARVIPKLYFSADKAKEVVAQFNEYDLIVV